MSDDRVGAESRSLLEDLWSTPVGRRWVLKAGLGSVAAASAALYGSPGLARAAKRAFDGVVAGDLQFALAPADGVSDLVLVANGQSVPLVAHTAASRTALAGTGGLWRSVDLSALTHFVSGVRLPDDRGLLVSVHGQRDGRQVLVAQVWHAPSQVTNALAMASRRLTGSWGQVVGSAHRLSALGLTVSDVRSAAAVAQLDSIGDSYQTATALTMCHPNVATVDATAVAATKSLLAQTPPVQTLGTYIAQMQRAGKDFASFVPAVDRDGSVSQIKVGDTTTGFSTIKLNTADAGLARAAKAAVAAGVVEVRDTASLGAVIDRPLDEDKAASTQTWVQPEGLLPQATPYAPAKAAAAGLDIKVKNDGLLFGTYTVVNGGYDHGKVPLKLYNNFVRWVWVYVQYLGANNENLSANPGAKFPDTKHAKSLGLLPQVFTVLGVPLWDTNTIDVNLDFPEGAHSARILYCGLGSNVLDGGWRQYFPADAYPDRIAPTDEVLFPALVTALFTIGVTVFALVSDIEIATTFATIKTILEENLEPALGEVESLLSATTLLTTSEAAAAAVAAGGATYADITSNGGSTANIWSILLGLASVIPKVLFGPGAGRGIFLRLAGAILAQESAARVTDAIPFIGEVIAVIELVGDAATLAEVCAETIVSPWVIENEVSLTYAAEVTVSRDPRSATFPATAVSWRLEALVDGALTLAPITDSINAGGRLRSDPLVLDVRAPFGGREIQWSVVFLDAAGKQVGTGVSAKFPNDDPAKPPSVVALAITQLPATITAQTVFKRADTTAYSTTAGGYTWSDQVKDTGTVISSSIQAVTGAAVATLAGVAGMVFKQDDRYWLRGVPVAQNGVTIKLGGAPKEGYARRPFLLLDAFVGRADRGNHVLLEPDEDTPGYHIRKVTLDPASGSLSWFADVSYGMFTLPVSAAALHSSGRVVAINTDSGRFGWLQPVSTPRPLLAAYTAGPGTQVGLLSSPIALAVTNPGVVLVLEAGSSQLAAFDLNGNPVRYFSGQFRVVLASAGTYLDVAVDGAAQIYVLYYIGDGSDPADYHVDVYTQAGAVLDTHSPGVNVPHLAVDYWRSIYAANYDPLADLETGKPHINPDIGVAEPSLSRFDPTEPSLAARKAPSQRRHRRRRAHHHHHR